MPKMTTEHFIESAHKIHGTKYNYSKSVYVNRQTPIEIICPKHGSFFITNHTHVYVRCGCKLCGDENKRGSRYTKEQMIHMAIDIHGNKYNYDKVKFIGIPKMLTKVDIVCPHHGVFNQTMSTHIYNKRGCRQCGLINGEKIRTIKITKSLPQFIEDAAVIHSNKYDYSLVEYINAHIHVTVICKTHGPFQVKPAKHLTDMQGCPACGMSRGELSIYKILRMVSVEFVCQHRFVDCVSMSGNQMVFDFWLPSRNLLIEYDGEQHYKEVPFNSKSTNLPIIQQRDNIKNIYAKEKGIRLVRIPYWDFNNIESILKIHLCD